MNLKARLARGRVVVHEHHLSAVGVFQMERSDPVGIDLTQIDSKVALRAVHQKIRAQLPGKTHGTAGRPTRIRGKKTAHNHSHQRTKHRKVLHRRSPQEFKAQTCCGSNYFPSYWM